MNKSCYFFGWLLFFSGCQYNRHTIIRKKHNHLQESLARLADIPDTPMYVHVKDIVRSDQNPYEVQILCTFGSTADRQDLKKFYIEEMDRLGWGLLFESSMQAIVLAFHKPDGRYCTVLIQERQELIVILCKAGD